MLKFVAQLRLPLFHWAVAQQRFPASKWCNHLLPPGQLSIRCAYSSAVHVLHHGSQGGEDTIYALATATGKAAIAIIRVSGPACTQVLEELCPRRTVPHPRRVAIRTLYDPSIPPSSHSVLDSNAVVLYFKGPSSATGEDVLELHVHGGPAVVTATLKAISKCSPKQGRIRYAEPGEFTRKAFFNGRLDLTQVEALGDVLSAVTEQQRKLSLRGTAGRLAGQYEAWRGVLLHARGELEALIDFAEDQHFDESPAALLLSVVSRVVHLRQQILVHLQNAMRGELLRSGIVVALVGAPNAGKSSLLNSIIGREAAIVSHEAGTTRDIVEVGIDLGGYLCRFGDMAGLRIQRQLTETFETIGAVEAEGIRRAKERALESDVVVVVVEVTLDIDGQSRLLLDPEVLQTAAACADRHIPLLAVINKIDRLPADQRSSTNQLAYVLQNQLPSLRSDSIFTTSCIAQPSSDLTALKAGLISTFSQMTSAAQAEDGLGTQDAIGVSERHRALLSECLQQLDKFIATADSVMDDVNGGVDIVLAAEILRSSALSLSRITGREGASDIEEVLGIIFQKFCVGK